VPEARRRAHESSCSAGITRRAANLRRERRAMKHIRESLWSQQMSSRSRLMRGAECLQPLFECLRSRAWKSIDAPPTRSIYEGKGTMTRNCNPSRYASNSFVAPIPMPVPFAQPVNGIERLQIVQQALSQSLHADESVALSGRHTATQRFRQQHRTLPDAELPHLAQRNGRKSMA
jgi:hypothetical protein